MMEYLFAFFITLYNYIMYYVFAFFITLYNDILCIMKDFILYGIEIKAGNKGHNQHFLTTNVYNSFFYKTAPTFQEVPDYQGAHRSS